MTRAEEAGEYEIIGACDKILSAYEAFTEGVNAFLATSEATIQKSPSVSLNNLLLRYLSELRYKIKFFCDSVNAIKNET